MTSTVRIDICPNDHVLMDQVLAITISGLVSGHDVTVLASVTHEKKTFHSCCCFVADKRGHVNIGTDHCVSGSYTGVSPMGIFWSMEPVPGQRKGIRLLKKDSTTPLIYRIIVYGGHMTSNDINRRNPPVLAEETVERWYLGRDVTRRTVKTGRIRGAVFIPKGEGPFQGVIEMYGGAGGLVELKSALLASRGFAVLALAYFGLDDLPDSYASLDLEYFMEAIDWLLGQPRVYTGGVGVMGVSKGGEIGMLMAAHSPKVKCVVNVCGPPFLRQFGMTFKGQRIPSAHPILSCITIEEGALCTTSETFDYTKEHITPVWRHDAQLLTILAGDDKNGTSPAAIEVLRTCYPADKLPYFHVIVYPGAGHILEPPYSHLCSLSYDKYSDGYMKWGGEPRLHAQAQEASWMKIQSFLREHIPRTFAVDAMYGHVSVSPSKL